MTMEKAPKHGGRETLAAIGDQTLPDFQKRDVRLATNEAEQVIVMRLYALGTTIPARGVWASRPRRLAQAMRPRNVGPSEIFIRPGPSATMRMPRKRQSARSSALKEEAFRQAGRDASRPTEAQGPVADHSPSLEFCICCWCC